jgi:RNA polymerase sigma factor (TIGR02999 family)
MPLVQGELKKIARRHLRSERPGHTLQSTALINEAFLRLVRVDVDWKDRAHFFAVAARIMRRILVDYARAQRREKRGGEATLLSLEQVPEAALAPAIDLVDLDGALRKLSELDDRKSRVVELTYFGGLTYDESAEALGISAATVHRELRLARAWLHQELAPPPA